MFAHAHFYDQMLKACLAVRACLSFTVWGFGDADSWVPGFFTGEGYAAIYDVNLLASRRTSTCSRISTWPRTARRAGGDVDAAGSKVMRMAEKEGFEPSMGAFTPITP